MRQSNSRSTAAERARIRRLRAMYRKRMLIIGVVFFIIGIVAGALVHSWFSGRRDVFGQKTPLLPTATPLAEQGNPFEGDLDDAGDNNGGFAVEPEDEQPAAEPTPMPTEAPTAEPTPEPTPAEAPKPKIQVPVTAEPEVEQPEAAPEQPAEQAAPEQPAEQAAASTEENALPAVAANTEAAPEQPAEQTAEQTAEQSAEQNALPMIAATSVDEGEPEQPAEAEPEQPAEQPAAPEQPAEPAAEPTAEPTAQPTPEPIAEPEVNAGPQVIAVVPFGESYTYTTQVKMDGTARLEADAQPFETLKFTQTMKEYLRPSDYANRYSTEFRLTGDEAGAGFELLLNDYVGTSVIVPQKVIDVGFCSATGNTVERGYQLMDKAISGNYDVAVESGTPKRLYKRYAYSNVGEEMNYLVVTTYNDGRQDIILFELEGEEPPEPEIVYPIMQKGLKSDDVRNMQERLIDLGYLKGKADGDFGKGTEAAVKKAQEAFGMEANGVADNDFQQKLYEGMASKPIPVSQQTPQPTANTEG